MTDGIIQEVIDNYMINHNISPALLNGLKHELIEKIKQEFPKSEIIKHDVQWKLIGDNQ